MLPTQNTQMFYKPVYVAIGMMAFLYEYHFKVTYNPQDER